MTPTAWGFALARVSLPALVVGLVLDNLSLLSLLRIVDGVLTRAEIPAPLPPEEILGGMLALGILCGVLGGYAAGRVAGRAEELHGVLVGLGDIVIGAWGLGVTSGITPFWYSSLAFAAAVPAAWAGGRLARRSASAEAA